MIEETCCKTQFFSALIFVPGNRADINFQIQILQLISSGKRLCFIEGDSYLRGRKGNYVERNDRLK
jgi:hypothetical protein